MQVIVKRSQLLSGGDVFVLGSYADDVAVAMAQQPQGTVLLSVSSTCIENASVGPKLIANWREQEKQTVILAEAKRRILDVFPEYSQRNSTHELTSYFVTHGPDEARWPAAAQQRKAEIDRCWNYVDAVRARSAALRESSLPADPTVDAHWPNRISSYKPL